MTCPEGKGRNETNRFAYNNRAHNHEHGLSLVHVYAPIANIMVQLIFKLDTYLFGGANSIAIMCGLEANHRTNE